MGGYSQYLNASRVALGMAISKQHGGPRDGNVAREAAEADGLSCRPPARSNLTPSPHADAGRAGVKLWPEAHARRAEGSLHRLGNLT